MKCFGAWSSPECMTPRCELQDLCFNTGRMEGTVVILYEEGPNRYGCFGDWKNCQRRAKRIKLKGWVDCPQAMECIYYGMYEVKGAIVVTEECPT